MKKHRRTEKRTPKKLELSGETTRILTTSDLGQAVGGEETGCSGSGTCANKE